MTKEERTEAVRRQIAEYTAAANETRQKAREALIREGIYTPDGNLAPRYRGEGNNQNAA